MAGGKSLEKNYLSGALIWAEAPCSVGALTARLPACGGLGLLTAAATRAAHLPGRTRQGLCGPGELPELSPALWNQVGSECGSGCKCVCVCV